MLSTLRWQTEPVPKWFRRPSKVAAPSATARPQPWMPVPPVQPRHGPGIVTAAAMLGLPAFFAPMRTLATAMLGLPVQDAAGEMIDLDPRTSDSLLARPTAHDTWPTFLDALMWSLMLHGNAFVLPTAVDSRTGAIASLQMVHPNFITPAWSTAAEVESFAVGAWFDGVYLAPSDFIHFREICLPGHSWGLSRVKILARAVELGLSEQAHALSTYRDGAQPTGYWRTDRVMDPHLADETAATLSGVIGGRGSGVAVAAGGLSWQQVSLNHADIQMLESRRHTASEAAAVLGVPAHLCGAANLDSETYSNVRMDMAAFDALTLERYRQIISREFALHGIDCRFGSSSLAGASEAERVQSAAAAVAAGIESPPQAAQRLGWAAPAVMSDDRGENRDPIGGAG